MSIATALYANEPAAEKRNRTVSLSTYEPNPEKEGYLRFVRNLTFGEAIKALVQALTEEELLAEAEYVGKGPICGHEEGNFQEKEIPKLRRISCSAEIGSNEGYFACIDLVPDATPPVSRQFFFGENANDPYEKEHRKQFKEHYEMRRCHAHYAIRLLTVKVWDEDLAWRIARRASQILER